MTGVSGKISGPFIYPPLFRRTPGPYISREGEILMKRATTLTSVFSMALAMVALVPEDADARRGGSFGSRGMRTYQSAPATRTAPGETAPVQRSMTAPPQAGQTGAAAARPGAPATAGAAAQAQPRRGGFLGGMGGGLLAGLVAGGLIGALMGNGFGGMAGMGQMLLQIALIGGAAWLLMALFRRRREATVPAGMAPAGMAPSGMAHTGFARDAGPFDNAGAGFGRSAAPAAVNPPAYTYEPQTPPPVDIGLLQADRDAFERLLGEVQDAFAREDYAALRERTTPEIMSYLSEELSQNAVQGRRNEVSDTRLLEADVAEAWREGDVDYATAALRYESRDVMRDRQTGAVVEGDPDRPTETTELWTFVRHPGADWKLSAIQDAA